LARYDDEAAGNVTRIHTGMKNIDFWLRGMEGGDLVVIGARSGHGKTALMCNICANYVKGGGKALILSLEMTNIQLVERLAITESGIPKIKLQQENPNESDWSAFVAAAGDIAAWPLYIDDSPSMKLSHILSVAEQHVTEKGVGLICIDYLQLIKVDRTYSREREVAGISAALKGLAKQLDVPVIVLCQLNREAVHRQDHRPRESDLRESDAIASDSDKILLLWRAEEHDRSDPTIRGDAEVVIEKNRGNPTGLAALRFVGELFEFTDDQFPKRRGS